MPIAIAFFAGSRRVDQFVASLEYRFNFKVYFYSKNLAFELTLIILIAVPTSVFIRNLATGSPGHALGSFAGAMRKTRPLARHVEVDPAD